MTKKIVVSRFVPRGSPLTHISILRREEHLLQTNNEWKQYEIIGFNVDHNITIFLFKINFKIIKYSKYLLFCYRIENRFEWEFPTFLSKFGFIGFIRLMEIQCMYNACTRGKNSRDRLEPEASHYPRISGRAVYRFNQRSYNYLNNIQPQSCLILSVTSSKRIALMKFPPIFYFKSARIFLIEIFFLFIFY